LVGTVGEPQSFLARADVFVLLSHSEGMPVSVLEAMRAGVPVVCSDLPGTRLELDDGRVGVLTGNDAPSAAKALRGLLDAPAVQRAELADAARARFEELFRIGPAVDAIEAVYERALDHHRRKPASGDR